MDISNLKLQKCIAVGDQLVLQDDRNIKVFQYSLLLIFVKENSKTSLYFNIPIDPKKDNRCYVIINIHGLPLVFDYKDVADFQDLVRLVAEGVCKVYYIDEENKERALYLINDAINKALSTKEPVIPNPRRSLTYNPPNTEKEIKIDVKENVVERDIKNTVENNIEYNKIENKRYNFDPFDQ